MLQLAIPAMEPERYFAGILFASLNLLFGTNTSNTVIIGVGTIGLLTACFLAELSRDSDQFRRVIVVDALENICAAASLYNSGILL